MKTIQFILSLMVVGLLASCSADSDVLNEMEEHNQLPASENVTVTLSLATGLTTRSIEEDLEAEKIVNGLESEIRNCVVLVLGQNDVFLKKLTKEDFSADESYTLTTKKQALKIYAIANFKEDDEALFTAANCEQYKVSFDYSGFLGNTPASDKPKFGYEDVAAGATSTTIHFKQLTARIDKPVFANDTYTYVSSNKNEEDVAFPLYIYPTETLAINVVGNYIDNGQPYSFGPFTIGGGEGVVANNIYKLKINASEPDMPGALWIDWYVAPMNQQNINAEVGGNN